MASAKISPDKVSTVFRAVSHKLPDTIATTAAYRAALRGLPIVVKATPSDTGQARAAWDVRRVKGGAELYNTAPHAATLEAGAAPHKPPLMPILRWVVRKWGLNLRNLGRPADKKPRRDKRSFESIKEVPWGTYLVAKSIQEKIEKEGSKPHGMISGNLQKLKLAYAIEVNAALLKMTPPK